MAKESGLGWTTCAVDDAAGSAKNIRNDVTQLSMATPRALQDVTGLDKAAMERLLLLADATGQLGGVFNDAASQAHAVFASIPSTSVLRTVTQAISGQTLAIEAVLTDYPLNRAQSGEFTFSVPYSLADGAVPAWA